MIEYKTLYQISTLLNKEPDIHRLVPLAIDKVIETTKAQRGLLMILQDGDLLFECARDQHKQNIAKPNLEISHTVIEKVLESGQTLVLENALKDPNIDTSASIKALNLISLACAPLKQDGTVFGVIYVDNRDVSALFDEKTRILLDELSVLISAPLKNSITHRRLIEQQKKLKAELREEKGYGAIIGTSQPMKEVFDMIERIADSDAIVLITGETGTGKELIARELHHRSARKEQDLVTLNCSAIPDNLLEAELFGHEKGAFTGADKARPGWFEAADGSTIFLDEIGELSPAAQARLLRLIQFGEYTPVGSKTSKKIDVRILAATNRNLAEMVEEEQFRRDLYYRLNVIEIKMPALRDRGHDILEIAKYFLKKFAKQANKHVDNLSEAACRRLLNYAFPGNVRELENIIQRAVLLCRGKTVESNDLYLTPLAGSVLTDGSNFREAKQGVIERFEKDFLSARLRETGGNITQAAKNAGMYKKNFMDKMKLYALRGEDYKDS